MKLTISGKVRDLFDATIEDDDGKKILEYDGYVPDCAIGDDDYIEMTIDMETGKIADWPGKEAILDAFKEVAPEPKGRRSPFYEGEE